MKPVTQGLRDIMSFSTFTVQELYTFTLIDGTVLRFADYDLRMPTLVANGQSYPPSGVLFERSQGKQAIGLQVGSMTVKIFADPTDRTTYVNGLTLQQFVRGGGLDGATLQLDRCFMQDWGDCAQYGTLLWFYGHIAETHTTRSGIQITVKSLPDRLSVAMPRDVYQPGCRNTLYEPNTCRLNRDNFAAGGIIVNGTITQTVFSAFISSPDGAFTLGSIHFLSGANVGEVRTVKAHSSGGFVAPSTITVTLPWITLPVVGDSFTVYYGCDKTLATCTNKFGNFANFRGEPFIPAPETATP